MKENPVGEIPPQTKGIARVLHACRYSFCGLVCAWRDESAFRQICVIFIAAVILALIFAKSRLDAIFLILPAWICVIIELLNTAIENVVDLATAEWHELAKKAKDLGSAAQFCSQGLLLFIWVFYFI